MSKLPAPREKFDLLVASAIIRSEKPTKGLEAIEAPNQQQMNRVIGHLVGGPKVVVSQRPGRGGMDFNKIVGGKVFAVAADGFSPVFEKGEDKKPTNKQKLENGLPAYSASGFYLMSSKDYPALDLGRCFVLLQDRGSKALLLNEDQLSRATSQVLESELDLDLLYFAMTERLGDANNLVARFDPDINKKRMRALERAKADAEDAGEEWAGASFAELAVSKKDGNPFLAVSWSCEGEHGATLVLREADQVDEDSGLIKPVHFDAEQAVARFRASKTGQRIEALLDSGKAVGLSVVQGNLMRTSVSFRRKAENVLTGEASSTYGDGVFIQGALKGWCPALVSIMHSQHPNFPNADYDAHHYVVAPRQAEVGMNKKSGGGWMPPVAVQYDVQGWLAAKVPQLAEA